MQFLDPKIDFVFKKLFGTQTKKEITISFLNSILNRSENSRIIDITDITFIDTNKQPETIDMKLTILDVHCVDQQGYEYIVEMQASSQKP